MTSEENDDLDRIISSIDPDHVPSEFVTAACITDRDEQTYYITREELEDIMLDEASLEEQGIVEVGLILNLSEIKETISHISEIILKDIAL